MSVGINTLVEETKKELADLINTKLKQGLPISVVGLLLDSLMYEVKNNIDVAIAQEQAKFKDQIKAESEQIEYDPLTSSETNVN